MSTPQAQAEPHGKLIFISYARADQDAADRIRQAVVAMHHVAWIDSNLEGGHAWWDEIIRELRDCDAVIVVVSPGLLDSEAAAAERAYAQSLGKPIIPIKVTDIRDDLLPPDIADRQYIDFTRPTHLTGIQLANVLFELPAAQQLPDELPAPPPIPRSYLSGISEMLYRPALTDDEQRAIAGKLSDALERPRERDAALELLSVLENRRDLYASTEREITRIRRELAAHDASASSTPQGRAPERTAPELAEARFGTPAQSAGQRPPADPGEQAQVRPEPTVQQPGHGTAPRQWPAPNPPAVGQRPPWPRPHWGLSITGLVFSFIAVIPLGVVAVVMSAQVSPRWNRGDTAGAFRASRLAAVWAWVGIGWGVLAAFYYVYLVQQSGYYS